MDSVLICTLAWVNMGSAVVHVSAWMGHLMKQLVFASFWGDFAEWKMNCLLFATPRSVNVLLNSGGSCTFPHANETNNESSSQEMVWALEQVPMEILSKIPNANSSTADRGEAHESWTERKVTCSTEPGQRKKINMAQREKESLLCGGVDVEEDVYNDRQLGRLWN